MQARCDRGAEIALLIGLSTETAEAIRGLDEHWDGRGQPCNLRGEEIPLRARILCLAQTLEIFHADAGVAAARAVAERRSGGWFDQGLVEALGPCFDDAPFWESLADPDVSMWEPEDRLLHADDARLDRDRDAGRGGRRRRAAAGPRAPTAATSASRERAPEVHVQQDRAERVDQRRVETSRPGAGGRRRQAAWTPPAAWKSSTVCARGRGCAPAAGSPRRAGPRGAPPPCQCSSSPRIASADSTPRPIMRRNIRRRDRSGPASVRALTSPSALIAGAAGRAGRGPCRRARPSVATTRTRATSLTS